jgi:hypothetical protein
MPNDGVIARLKQRVWPNGRRTKQSDHEEALVTLANGRYESAAKKREPYVQDWVRNVHFYAGNQYITLDSVNGVVRYRQTRFPKWKSRVTENRMLRLLQSTANMIVGERPDFTCVAGPDMDDRIACELGEQVLRTGWHTFGLDALFEECALWMLLTGLVGLVTRWDAHAGPVRPVPLMDEDTGEPLLDDDGQPMAEDRRGRIIYDHVGDVRHTVIPPNLFLPDPFAIRPRDINWYIYHPYRSMEYVAERWPDKVDDVQPEQSGGNPFTELNAGDYFGQSGWAQSNPTEWGPDEGVTVKEMVVKPNVNFPQGAVIHTAGNVLLDVVEGLDPDCLENDSLGIELARCFTVPGRFWPTSLADQLISPQQLLNETQSQLHDARKLTCYPKVLVPRGARLAKGAFSTSPNEKIEYQPGYRPSQWEPPSIPHYVQRMVDTIPLIMQEISGTHQASLGQAPKNLRSGTAIGMVQSQDQQGWSSVTRELERMMEGTGRRTLFLIKELYLEERLMPVVGQDTGEAEMRKFRGADLTGVSDVQIVRGSSLLRNKEHQRAWLQELMNSQLGQVLIASPVMVNRIMEAFDLGHISVVTDSLKANRSAALRAIKDIEDSEGAYAPKPQPWWEHDVVLRVLADDLMSEKTNKRVRQYAEMGEEDPVHLAKAQLWAATLDAYMALNAPPPEEDGEGGGKAQGSDSETSTPAA